MVNRPIEPKPTDAGALMQSFTAYEFDYFSGSQIGVYIGDILVDDIMSIQFNVAQSKRPIHGYASQYYHTLADGQVLVQGQFAIPFKEADYLLAVLQRYRDHATPIEDVYSPTSGRRMDRQKVLRENIERYIERTSRDPNLANPYELALDLSALRDEAFEDMAEQFEDLLWQVPKEKFLEPNVSPHGMFFSDYTRRADQYPPFDIFVLYGDIANAAANHTIKRLVDVSILGQGQAISVGGEPIIEVYSFIAKNLA